MQAADEDSGDGGGDGGNGGNICTPCAAGSEAATVAVPVRVDACCTAASTTVMEEQVELVSTITNEQIDAKVGEAMHAAAT